MPEDELLIYDADCAFCTSCLRWGQTKLAYFPRVQGFQSLKPELYGLKLTEVQSSIWLIRKDQKPLSANLAATAILKSQPNYLWRMLGHLADSYWIRPFAKTLYFTIARNRHRLPGATEACEVKPDDK